MFIDDGWPRRPLLALLAACTLVASMAAPLRAAPDISDRGPGDCRVTQAVRDFVAKETPAATTAQRRHFGLHLPADLDPHHPLIVLIHGLECDSEMWGSMQCLLTQSKYQVATFGYPGAGPISDDSELLGREMSRFRATYPDVRIDLITHSMGGLVARDYLEGPDYHGGIDRFILLAPPNAGSTWATCRTAMCILAVHEQVRQWHNDPDWRASWIVTDGLGEAGRDLRPGSAFLAALNARPRRDGVRYTIVAGDLPPTSEIGSALVSRSSECIPKRVAGWWAIRNCKAALDKWAMSLSHRTADGDGPVTLTSARLPGVSDFVVIHAGHTGVALAEHPAAWEIIHDRLGK